MRSITSLATAALGLALVLTGPAACSGDDPPPVETPSSTEVREFFGYTDGSCWRYRFIQNGAPLFATAFVEGPNDTSIAGSTVYVRSFRFESGGLPEEWFLDAETAPEVRLLRSTSGLDRQSRETRRYEMTAPLFAELSYDFGTTEIEIESGDAFETETTPTVCTGVDQACEPGALEAHEWTVTSTTTDVSTPDGVQSAVRMQYRVRTDDGTDVRIYDFVPGRGIARFIDGDGRQYQVCDWRVCDAAGNCEGAPSCDALTCN